MNQVNNHDEVNKYVFNVYNNKVKRKCKSKICSGVFNEEDNACVWHIYKIAEKFIFTAVYIRESSE